MTVLKFRVVLDTKKDVFRDIEILTDQTFEEFHYGICKAFDFAGDQMASFYMSDDEWNKGQEITLMDMGVLGEEPKDGDPYLMEKTTMDDMIIEEDEKLVYVYDFLSMWCFFIELIEESNPVSGREYPWVALKFGDAPKEDSKLETDTMMGLEGDEEITKDGLSGEISEMFGDAEEEEEDSRGDNIVDLEAVDGDI